MQGQEEPQRHYSNQSHQDNDAYNVIPEVDEDDQPEERDTVSERGSTSREYQIIAQSRELVGKLRQELIEEKTRSVSLSNQIEQLQEIIRNNDDDTEIRSIMRQMKNSCDSFQTQAEAAITERNEMSDKLRNVMDISQKYKEAHIKKDEMLNKMRSEFQNVLSLKESYQKIETENKQLKKTLEEREKQLIFTLEKVKEREGFEDEITKFSQEMQNTQQMLAKEQIARKEAEGICVELSTLNDQLRESFQKAQNVIKESESSRKSLNKQNFELQNKFQELEDINRKTIQDLRNQVQELKEENQEISSKLQKLRKQKQVQIEEIEKLKDSEAESKGLTSRLNNEINRLKDEYFGQIESTKNVSTHREVLLASKEDELEEALYKLSLLAKKFEVKYWKK